MSRSRKQPYYTDQQVNRPSQGIRAKQRANRAVRRANKKACVESEKDTLSDGKSYRKEFDSWNIRDWTFHAPKDKKAYRK